jgi:hypothetical protein
LQATLTQMRGAAPAAVGAALFLEGEQIMAASKPLVPVDMGPLRASGHVQLPKVTPDHVSVTMGYGGTASGYAVYLHEGTGPAVGRPAFFPPLAVIEAWVRRNLHPAENEVRGLTFIVARAIGQRGQKPLKYLERPFNAAKPGMEGRLARSLRAWLDRQQVHDVA